MEPRVNYNLPSKKHVVREAIKAKFAALVAAGNPNHCGPGQGGGRFTDEAGTTCDVGAGVVKSKRSKAKVSAPGAVPQPPFGAEQFDGKKGKPIPGTDAWLHAHNISRESYESRPYQRFEAGTKMEDLPQEIQDLYKGEPEATAQLERVMAQTGGIIMVRRPVPGAEPIVPQLRPDVPVVMNPGERKYREVIKDNAAKRAEEMKALDAEGVIALQESRIAKAEARLAAADTHTKESFLAPAVARVEQAKAELELMKEDFPDDEESIKEAQKRLNSANSARTRLQKQADHYFGRDPEKGASEAEIAASNAERAAKTEQYRAWAKNTAEKEVANAKKKLERVKADPEAAIAREIETSAAIAKDTEAAWQKTEAKYLFPPNPKDKAAKAAIDAGKELGKAGRVEMHDAENVRRLVEGKGRVYVVMEGNLKSDAVLTAIKQEHEDAVVISVPSVTLWRHKEMVAVAQDHLKGREIVLIPDADGVNNPRVRNEARAMEALLRNAGAGDVHVAPPPIPLDTKGRPIRDERPGKSGKVMIYDTEIPGSPKGTREELKGVDDYLGLGKAHPEAKGTLGNLAVQRREIPMQEIKNLAIHDRENRGGTGTISTKNRETAVATLTALSTVLGDVGAGKIGTKALAAAIGKPNAAANASNGLDYLQNAGVITIKHVFKPDQLLRGIRERNEDPVTGFPDTEEGNAALDRLVRRGVIDRPAFGEDDTRPIDYGYEEQPIIEFTERGQRYKAKDNTPVPLSSLPSSQAAATPTRIRSLASSGKTYAEIANILGISNETIAEVLA